MGSFTTFVESGRTFNEQIDLSDLERTLVNRFEEIVSLYPGNLAVVQDGRSYIYQQINQLANQVGYILLNTLEDYRGPVAFLVDHGFPQIVTIFGILKSGNGYIALDPDFPVDRLEFMLTDSESPLVITNNKYLSFVEELNKGKLLVINLDEIDPNTPAENLNLDIPLDAMALLQYTSGSTGQPKGVIMPHQYIMHMAYTFRAFTPQDRYIYLVSGSFAAHLGPVFYTMLSGASVFPYNLKDKGLAGLADFLVDEKITILQAIPSTFRYFTSLLDEDIRFPDIRLVILSADTCLKVDVEMYKRFFPPSCTLMNILGGTEFMTGGFYVISKDTEIEGGVVPVGYKPEDKEVFIINEDGNEVHAGETGEIVVQSRYLSPGYWKRPDLTKEKFQPVPGEDGVFRYHSGDLGRKDVDGCLYHLGRIDDQVKIRGNRIELGEITSSFFEIPSIKDAYVGVNEDAAGEKVLTAYLVPKEGSVLVMEEVMDTLLANLPSYMVPAEMMVVDKIPKLSSGKVDRSALPKTERSRAALGSDYVEPRNLIEETLVRIWEDLLGFEPVGVKDDFFALGGHSLLALRLIARIENELKMSLPASALTQVRTIDEMAAFLQDETAMQSWSSLVALQPLGEKRPIFFVPPSGVTAMIFDDLARYMGKERPFYVLEFSGMEEGTEPHDDVREMARYNLERMKLIQQEGPYFVGGMCFGGIVAYEMAHQLIASGEKVAFLGVLDSSFPPRQRDTLRSTFIYLLTLLNENVLKGRLPIGPEGPRNRVRISDVDPAMQGRIQRVYTIHNRASLRYKSPPIQEKIHLFNTRRRQGQRIKAEWQKATVYPLEGEVIPGHHGRGFDDGTKIITSFILEPNVQILAVILNNAMAEAGAAIPG